MTNITIDTSKLDKFTAKMLLLTLADDSCKKLHLALESINEGKLPERNLIQVNIEKLSVFEIKNIAMLVWNSDFSSVKMKYNILKYVETNSLDPKDFNLFLGSIQKLEDDRDYH